MVWRWISDQDEFSIDPRQVSINMQPAFLGNTQSSGVGMDSLDALPRPVRDNACEVVVEAIGELLTLPPIGQSSTPPMANRQRIVRSVRSELPALIVLPALRGRGVAALLNVSEAEYRE